MPHTTPYLLSRHRPVLLILGFFALLGCATAAPERSPSHEPLGRIYLVSHGWHVGIVVSRHDIPAHLWPEHRELPASAYVEVGWGDQAFYQAPKATLGLLLGAALKPTPSVLHLVWFDQPVPRYFPVSEIIEVEVTPEGFEALARFIAASYYRDAGGKTVALGPGLYGTSAFYQANGKYHLFNTCNTWTAQALRAAGCPMASTGILTAEKVMARATPCGRRLRRSR